MRAIYQWLVDLAHAVREIAKAAAHARSHPSEPPEHK